MKQILATMELSLNMGGNVYDVLLIPRDRLVDVDYSQVPERDPRNKPEWKAEPNDEDE